MSQTIDSVKSLAFDRNPEPFTYRPMPPLAPVTMFIGVCSLTALFSVIGLAVSLCGVVLGTACLLKIWKARGELGGCKLTLLGTGLSAFLLVSGSGLQAYLYATEIPEGFQRISFTKEISQKGLITENGVRRPHPDVASLDGKKIFLKGYMYPMRQIHGLNQFVLVKDNQQCCFGGQPDVKDMVMVRMRKGREVSYHQTLVSIAGIFRSHATEQNTLGAVYELEGLYCEPSRTMY